MRVPWSLWNYCLDLLQADYCKKTLSSEYEHVILAINLRAPLFVVDRPHLQPAETYLPRSMAEVSASVNA